MFVYVCVPGNKTKIRFFMVTSKPSKLADITLDGNTRGVTSALTTCGGKGVG